MRICLYVGRAPEPDQLKEWLKMARTTCDVYARNLYYEFTRRGHEVVFGTTLAAKPRVGYYEGEEAKRIKRYGQLDYPEADHAICLQQNGWSRREPIFFEKARAATKGLVCAICDHDGDIGGPQDVLFVARRPTRDPSRAVYIGWAADPKVFKPQQDPDWLTIFIDHKANPNGDDTEALLKSATQYAARLEAEGRKVGEPPRRVQVAFFSPDGIERIEPGEVKDVDLGTDIRQFYRTRVPGPEMQHWLRKTDIFVVTHGESMGLPVLESAMAGALVLARRGYIKPEFLQSLGHYEYDEVEAIDWDALVATLQPKAFRKRALSFSWGTIAERMLDTLEGRGSRPQTAEQMGKWLVVPPAPVADGDFGDLAAWEATNIGLEQTGDGSLLVAAGEGKHSLRRGVRKNPWPELFTVSFLVKPVGSHDLRVSMWGHTPESRVDVLFDFDAKLAHPGRAMKLWSCLDARVVPAGDQLLCQVAAITDWSPIVNCSLTLARDGEVVFDAGDADPAIAVSNLSLHTGVGVAKQLESIPKPGADH